jgi:hypothetical protein
MEMDSVGGQELIAVKPNVSDGWTVRSDSPNYIDSSDIARPDVPELRC